MQKIELKVLRKDGERNTQMYLDIDCNEDFAIEILSRFTSKVVLNFPPDRHIHIYDEILRKVIRNL